MQAISFSQETLVYDCHAEKSHPPYGLFVILLIVATISSNVSEEWGQIFILVGKIIGVRFTLFTIERGSMVQFFIVDKPCKNMLKP
jgi:hypothetical protein